MKYTLATSLVVALLMNSSEVAGTQIAHHHKSQQHARAVQSESDSESEEEAENV
jgi:hypothetical protein